MAQRSLEEQLWISQLKLRSAQGHPNPPTLDEMKRYIVLLRGERTAACEASAASAGKRASKAAKVERSTDDLLDALENM